MKLPTLELDMNKVRKLEKKILKGKIKTIQKLQSLRDEGLLTFREYKELRFYLYKVRPKMEGLRK